MGDNNHYVKYTHFTLASTMQKNYNDSDCPWFSGNVSSHPRREGGYPRVESTTTVTLKDTWLITPRPKYRVWMPWERPKPVTWSLTCFPPRAVLPVRPVWATAYLEVKPWQHGCTYSQNNHHKSWPHHKLWHTDWGSFILERMTCSSKTWWGHRPRQELKVFRSTLLVFICMVLTSVCF